MIYKYVLGCIATDEEVFAVWSGTFNLWMLINYRGEVLHKGSIDKYLPNDNALFWILDVDGFFIGIPYYGIQIIIWDKNNYKMDILDLPNIPSMKTMDIGKFSSYCLYNDKLYLFPFQTDDIWVFDIVKKKFFKKIEFRKYLIDNFGISYKYGLSYGGYRYGNKYYLCSFEKGIVVEFNFNNDELKTYYISDVYAEIANVSGYDEKMYFITYDREIISFDLNFFIPKKIVKFDESLFSGSMYDGVNLVIYKNTIYVIPNYAEETISFNLLDSTCSRIFDVETYLYKVDKIKHIFFGYNKDAVICFFTDKNSIFFYDCIKKDIVFYLDVVLDKNKLMKEIIAKSKRGECYFEDNLNGLESLIEWL